MNNVHINYIEFKALDLEAVKTFYNRAFGWEFTDFGPAYTAFSGSGVEGGFEKTEGEIVNGVLVVLHHKDLESIQTKVEKAGGRISVPIFSFPGGRRFQFLDPSGNELAIWTETES
ncbi:MAG: VOC family protein [Balneola sp.]